MNLAFYRFKDMDLVEQVHIFGLSNIHTEGSNSSLIRLFSLIFNYAKPRLIQHTNLYCTFNMYCLHLNVYVTE